MNFITTNRRTTFFAASALASVALAAALPQVAGAQTGAMKPHMGAGASGGMDPAVRAKMMAAQQRQQKMIADLHVTPDQQAKMKKVQMDMQPKMMAVNSNKSLTVDQKKTQMMALATKYRAEMNAILTPEQQTKIKAMQQQMMQQRMQQMQQMQAAGMTKGGAAKPAH